MEEEKESWADNPPDSPRAIMPIAAYFRCVYRSLFSKMISPFAPSNSNNLEPLGALLTKQSVDCPRYFYTFRINTAGIPWVPDHNLLSRFYELFPWRSDIINSLPLN